MSCRQFTNLKEQARSLGISTSKWGKVAKSYADVNKMFGDIVKVTPSSKVVGDMALYMITNDLSVKDILDKKKEIIFPQSVIDFFKGELGTPHGGFPKDLQKKILGKEKPIIGRPGAFLNDINIQEEKINLEKNINQKVNNRELISYLMYPKVFLDLVEYQKKYGDQPRIQLNDKFSVVSDVGAYILAERATKREELQNVLTTSLKVDGETNMGLITDIKQELRKVNALKINYTTRIGDYTQNK